MSIKLSVVRNISENLSGKYAYAYFRYMKLELHIQMAIQSSILCLKVKG